MFETPELPKLNSLRHRTVVKQRQLEQHKQGCDFAQGGQRTEGKLQSTASYKAYTISSPSQRGDISREQPQLAETLYLPHALYFHFLTACRVFHSFTRAFAGREQGGVGALVPRPSSPQFCLVSTRRD